MQNDKPGATYGPAVETCAQYGIKRGQFFALQKESRALELQGQPPLIETFKIGNKTFITHRSLQNLPERLAKREVV